MGKRNILSSLFMGLLVVSGCGGRTTMEELEDEAFESGGSPAVGGSLVGGFGFGGNASGGRATTTVTYAYGGQIILTRGGSVGRGGASGGNRFAGGGNRFAGGGNRFAVGGAAVGGYAGRPIVAGGGYSGAGRGGLGGCAGWAGCGFTFGGRGGSGGYGATAGVHGGAAGATHGGTPSTIPSCVPGVSIGCVCPDGSSGAQICQANGTYAGCSCLLTEMRAKIVGAWAGNRTTVWDGTHPVKMTFTSDGHYSAYCADGCSALYWGDDVDNTTKTYSIDAVNSAGTGFGRITIYFATSGVTNNGELLDVTFDTTGNTLTFAMWYGTYGPVTFALTR